MLAHELCAEQPPAGRTWRWRHAVKAALPRLGVVVVDTAADVRDYAVEVIRQRSPVTPNVRAQDL